MLLKQRVDKSFTGIWSQHDVQLFTYGSAIYDSNFDIAFNMGDRYVGWSMQFGTQNVNLYAGSKLHKICNNAQQSWHKEVAAGEHNKSYAAVKQNYQKYDYISQQQILYRVPKTLIILWNEGLEASYKRAIQLAYEAISAATLPEISDIILRATLHCIMWDLDNYVDTSAA